MSAKIPERPRLASFVRARRHVVDGVTRVILHDDRGGGALALGAREWSVLGAMDGTRDLAGIRLGAGFRGTRVSAAHVESFVAQLATLGLLDDAEPPGPESAFARDVPVRALPDYRLACDGRGGCCRLFPTILFTPLEAARARAAAPEVLDGGQRPEEVFTPEHGLDETLCAVTHVDGACAYLADDGRCRIHAAAGADAKPFGCRSFPLRFVDTGEEIRAGVRVECACVLESALHPGHERLTEATRGRELPAELFVSPLPATVTMGPTSVSASELVAWSDGLTIRDDAPGWCVALADEVERLGPAARGEGLTPDPRARLGPELERIEAAADRFLRERGAWRAEVDLVRRGVEWVRSAAARARAQRDPPAETERFAVRATLFCGGLAEGPSVESGLRTLAAHLLVARAFPAEARAEPAARHPFALVEALARGHGVTSREVDAAY